MQKRRLPFLLLLGAAILFPGPCLWAEDPVQICNARLDGQIQALLENLTHLENHYVHYRWTEIKIRELYYDPLWQARRDSLDPLSPKKREAGKEEEERLLDRLSLLEKEALVHSNGFSETLRDIQNAISNWGQCCPEKNFLDCAAESFKKIDVLSEQVRTEFDHVFEHEREFRKAVMLTAGGREGLYPEDAVEEPVQHGEYYWRFEADRKAARFEEDQRIRNSLREIEKILTWKFEGKRCCLECGKK